MELNPVKFVETNSLKNPAYWLGTDSTLQSATTESATIPNNMLFEGVINSPTLFGANVATLDYANSQGACHQVDGYIPKVLNARVGEDYLTADLIPFTPIPKSLDLQQRGLREFLK
tara:strand:+ start:229 stop:576 length:348 start_codon:yes stop_codon:yes gene_type:complete